MTYLVGAFFYTSPHTCMSILFGTRNKKVDGVHLLRGRHTVRICGYRARTSSSSPSANTTPPSHSRGIKGLAVEVHGDPTPSSQMKTEVGPPCSQEGLRFRAHCPLKHIKTLLGLHSPAFVHLFFSARLPRLFIFLKVLVVQHFREALPDRHDHWLVLCTPQSGSASTLC